MNLSCIHSPVSPSSVEMTLAWWWWCQRRHSRFEKRSKKKKSSCYSFGIRSLSSGASTSRLPPVCSLWPIARVWPVVCFTDCSCYPGNLPGRLLNVKAWPYNQTNLFEQKHQPAKQCTSISNQASSATAITFLYQVTQLMLAKPITKM